MKRLQSGSVGIFVSLSLFVALGWVGCTKKSDAPEASSPQSGSAKQSPGSERVLNLAIWSNYVSPAMVAEFEKRSGIKLQISNYSSNEELLAKLQAGASGYDVIVPSDYMVFAMVKLGLLKALDRTQLPHSANLDPRVLKKTYDPENVHSLPYDWGTTGIAVNKTLFKGKIRGWKDLFSQPELKGKLTLLDDVRETVGAALKAQGLSLNTRDSKDLAKAKELLLKVKPRIKGFNSETKVPLVQGEVAVAHAYSVDSLQAAQATGGKVEYVIPEEGGTLWVDNLAIPATAAHVVEAHQFIDFLLEAKTEASTATVIFSAPSNRDALALLPADLQKNPGLFPSDQVLKKMEMMEDLGEGLSAWDRVWTEVKASAGE